MEKLKKDFGLKTLNLNFAKNNTIRNLNSGIDRFGEISVLDEKVNISTIEKELNKVNSLLIEFLYDLREE